MQNGAPPIPSIPGADAMAIVQHKINESLAKHSKMMEGQPWPMINAAAFTLLAQKITDDVGVPVGILFTPGGFAGYALPSVSKIKVVTSLRPGGGVIA
jgi:hypothetical protein